MGRKTTPIADYLLQDISIYCRLQVSLKLVKQFKIHEVPFAMAEDRGRHLLYANSP